MTFAEDEAVALGPPGIARDAPAEFAVKHRQQVRNREGGTDVRTPGPADHPHGLQADTLGELPGEACLLRVGCSP